MGDVAKSILGGAWSLLVGWILPTFLVLESVALLVAPALQSVFGAFLRQPFADRQLSLLFLAVVIGFLLSALGRQLYQVLEGHLLWPDWLKRWGTTRQQRKRQRVVDRAVGDQASHVWSTMRFPASSDDVVPTALGNSIRRFETYASDRYSLDAITLFHQLAAHTPGPVLKAQEQARASVDFAVCVVWTTSIAATLSIGAWIFVAPDARLLVFGLVGYLAAVGAYRLAVVSADEWAAAVRAQVDLGRVGLAGSFGLYLPDDLAEEREMWSYLSLFVRAPFEQSGTAAEWISYHRVSPTDRLLKQVRRYTVGGGSVMVVLAALLWFLRGWRRPR